MNRYENAIFLTITEDEGLYTYFRDIWKDCKSTAKLSWKLGDYFEGLINHIPRLYNNLVKSILKSNLIDFYVVAENLIDLF